MSTATKMTEADIEVRKERYVRKLPPQRDGGPWGESHDSVFHVDCREPHGTWQRIATFASLGDAYELVFNLRVLLRGWGVME